MEVYKKEVPLLVQLSIKQQKPTGKLKKVTLVSICQFSNHFFNNLKIYF